MQKTHEHSTDPAIADRGHSANDFCPKIIVTNANVSNTFTRVRTFVLYTALALAGKYSGNRKEFADGAASRQNRPVHTDGSGKAE